MFLKKPLGQLSQEVALIQVLHVELQGIHFPLSLYYLSGQDEEHLVPYKTLGDSQDKQISLAVPSLHVRQLASHFSHKLVLVFLKEPVSQESQVF